MGCFFRCYFPVCTSLSAESGSLREVRLLSECTQIAVIYSGSHGRGSGRANEHFGTVRRNFNQTLSGEERSRPAADDASHHAFSVERKERARMRNGDDVGILALAVLSNLLLE